jgi:hypothetical protein
MFQRVRSGGGLVGAVTWAWLTLAGGTPSAAQVPFTITDTSGGQATVPSDDVGDLARAIEEQLQRRQVLPLIADPQVRALAAAPLNQVALEVSKEAGPIGKARLAFPLGVDTSLDLVLKGALSSTGAGTPLTSASGLSDGASIRTGIHHTFWKRTSTVNPGGFQIAAQSLSGDNYEQVAQMVLSYETGRLTPTTASARGLQAIANIQDRDARARAAVDAALISTQSSLFVDAAYERTEHAFEFTTLADVQRQRVTETGEMLAFSLGFGKTGTFDGVATRQPLFYAGLSFTGGTSFTGAPKQQICLPVAGSVATRCVNTATAGPTEADAQIWKLESRHWVRDQKLGINPEFIYDAENDARELALNLSALVFKKAMDGSATYELDTTALSAGFRLGYIFDGEQKGPAASVFFSTVLGLW